jgi:hypothetical protein
MTAIPLTSHALKGIKRTIHEALPEIGSAHLSEAIAAGLGYRTHAALLIDVGTRSDDDPDYAYLDDEQLADRASALSGKTVDTWDIATLDFSVFGAINTRSSGAGRIDLHRSTRKRAWRNAMVAAINAGLEQRLFSIRPGDCRWPEWSADSSRRRGTEFTFSVGDIPAIGWVNDAGFNELAIHVALWPSSEGKRFVGAINGGFLAGEVFAMGWLEREEGAWLQVGNGAGASWTFRCRRERLAAVAALDVRPRGYAADGSFVL